MYVFASLETIEFPWSHQNFASIIINRHKASIPDACSTGYWKEEKSVSLMNKKNIETNILQLYEATDVTPDKIINA